MENYYRELVCFLNAKLGNRQVAEDVVHDAYVRVLERQTEPLEVLDSEERFAACSPHASHDQGQRLEMLERALAELPVACRDSFLLRKLEGLSHVQIAERLNISRSLVEKHIVNAMKHCRVRMREWEAH